MLGEILRQLRSEISSAAEKLSPFVYHAMTSKRTMLAAIDSDLMLYWGIQRATESRIVAMAATDHAELRSRRDLASPSTGRMKAAATNNMHAPASSINS